MTALWLAALLALGLGQLMRPQPALLAAWTVMASAPALSWLLLTLHRKKLSLTLEAPGIGEKGKPFSLTLCLKRDTCLPIARAEVLLELTNTATGEQTRQKLPLAGKTRFPICSDYCGCLSCRVVRLRCFEPFGLLPLPPVAGPTWRVVIMPRTFPVEVGQTPSARHDTDSQEYAPEQRGFDRTETWQIREYVPGDTLQQIHWKLSSKHSRLMVREGSLPVDRSLTVFLDLADGSRTPAAADALLEAVCSLSQALTEAGLPFRLAWNGETLCDAQVPTAEQLPEALCRLLKARPDPAAVPGSTIWQQGAAGRVLYFCSALPPQPWPGSGLSFFLCGEAEEPSVTAFTPENVSQQLRFF